MATKTKPSAASAKPVKTAAKASIKTKKSADKKPSAPRHPHARVAAKFGTKADLVATLVGPLTRASDDADALKAKLLKASNQQLLHLASVVETVTKKFGGRDKLVSAIATGPKAKDADYIAKLGKLSLPQLLDLGSAAQRRAKRA